MPKVILILLFAICFPIFMIGFEQWLKVCYPRIGKKLFGGI